MNYVPQYHLQLSPTPDYSKRSQPISPILPPKPPLDKAFMSSLVPTLLKRKWESIFDRPDDTLLRPLKRSKQNYESFNFSLVFDIFGFWLLTSDKFQSELYDNNDEYIARYIPLAMLWRYMSPITFHNATCTWLSTDHIQSFYAVFGGQITVSAYSKTIYKKNIYRLDVQAAYLRRCSDMTLAKQFMLTETELDYDWDLLEKYFPQSIGEYERRFDLKDFDEADSESIDDAELEEIPIVFSNLTNPSDEQLTETELYNQQQHHIQQYLHCEELVDTAYAARQEDLPEYVLFPK